MKMHDQYSGVFLASDSQFTGYLSIAGSESVAKLVGKSFWPYTEAEYTNIHGMLGDGSKASLLDCVPRGRTQHRFDENTQYENTFFPNYVVVGEEFIQSNEPVIRAVHYHFENVDKLLSGHKTFKSLSPDRDVVHRLLEEEHRRLEETAEQYGWPKHPFEIEIGEHPHLLYFSGVWEIIASDTSMGRISLTNRASRGYGTAAGIGINNEVTANIEFAEAVTLTAATRALRTLHGLFELSLGRRQRYQWIELELTHLRKDVDPPFHQRARLYWSLCNERVKDDPKTSRLDVLLAPDRRPEEFAKVVAGWMDSAETMGDPRERFATAFFGRYGIDRIVGAANMFDLLPESHAPKKKQPDAPLKAAVDQSRGIFAALPDSFSKQAVLSALGRVGTASLRDKVYHRVDRIMAVVGDKFPDLYTPCNHAVLARNHYVHGSKASFNYQDNFTGFVFITDTLEFVFGASDLLDLGWDLKGWLEGGMSMEHAFSEYVINFPANMQYLNALLKA